ncbi:MAG: hypothetical protein HQL18_02715, partial [Candidatus Omnitrophica bacterium]|nr:hypothetical protein [Candidatus Omnitrophota bacterium]
DPNLRAALTYVNRIDRLLSQRDFEEQRLKIKRENRSLERRQEKKEGIVLPGNDEDKDGLDPKRADVAYEEGVWFYKDKRYKEARLKLEEVLRIGDDNQRAKAKKYLDMIEQGIENERVRLEKEKTESHRRYLEARRAEDQVSWGHRDHYGDKGEGDEEESAIRQQLKLRDIERENASEREKMLRDQNVLNQQARNAEVKERIKYIKMARTESMATGCKLPGEPPAIDGAYGKPTSTDLQLEADSQDKLGRQRNISGRTLSSSDRAEARRLMAKSSMKGSHVSKPAEPEAEVPSAAPIDLKRAQQEENRRLKVAAEKEKKTLEEQRLSIQRDFETGVEQLYVEGQDLYKQNSFADANERFQQIQSLIPGYKKTEYYLQKIGDKLAHQRVSLPSSSKVGK